MIRHSILNNNKRFKSALLDVNRLISQGMTHSEEIARSLSSTYQEGEIEKLVGWIKDLSKTTQYTREKTLLKISLWILLSVKLLFFPSLHKLLLIEFPWNTLLLFIMPALNIIAIILVYHETSITYVLIFCLYALGLSGITDSIISLFSFETGLITWIFGFINIISFFVGGYCSFKLFRSLPQGLLKTKIIARQLKLDFTAVA